MKFKCKFLYLLINYKNSNSAVGCPVKTLLTRSAPAGAQAFEAGQAPSLQEEGEARERQREQEARRPERPSSSAAGLWHTPRGLRSGICMRAAHADPEPAGRGPRGGREATLFGRRLEAGDSAAITEPAARELLPFPPQGKKAPQGKVPCVINSIPARRHEAIQINAH